MEKPSTWSLKWSLKQKNVRTTTNLRIFNGNAIVRITKEYAV